MSKAEFEARYKKAKKKFRENYEKDDQNKRYDDEDDVSFDKEEYEDDDLVDAFYALSMRTSKKSWDKPAWRDDSSTDEYENRDKNVSKPTKCACGETHPSRNASKRCRNKGKAKVNEIKEARTQGPAPVKCTGTDLKVGVLVHDGKVQGQAFGVTMPRENEPPLPYLVVLQHVLENYDDARKVNATGDTTYRVYFSGRTVEFSRKDVIDCPGQADVKFVSYSKLRCNNQPPVIAMAGAPVVKGSDVHVDWRFENNKEVDDWISFGKVMEVDNKQLKYNCFTKPGVSGAPVIVDGCVVAVHTHAVNVDTPDCLNVGAVLPKNL